ncbi:MAG: CmcI family methyltransferase, partial [Dongiaceae bacterium]
MIAIDLKKGVVTTDQNGKKVEHTLASPEGFHLVSKAWMRAAWDAKYMYGFTWLGRPVIQMPEDMIRIQEVIFTHKPDVVIETGIAHGGSLIFYASLFKAMGRGRVIGVDIEIRPHNRKAMEDHPLTKEFITMIEGSSTDPKIVDQVRKLIKPGEKVMVILDS